MWQLHRVLSTSSTRLYVLHSLVQLEEDDFPACQRQYHLPLVGTRFLDLLFARSAPFLGRLPLHDYTQSMRVHLSSTIQQGAVDPRIEMQCFWTSRIRDGVPNLLCHNAPAFMCPENYRDLEHEEHPTRIPQITGKQSFLNKRPSKQTHAQGCY